MGGVKSKLVCLLRNCLIVVFGLQDVFEAGEVHLLPLGIFPRSKRGLHFHINSILNDENVHSKMVSFLREHKFDVTAQQVCEYRKGLEGRQAEFAIKI